MTKNHTFSGTHNFPNKKIAFYFCVVGWINACAIPYEPLVISITFGFFKTLINEK